MGFNPGRDSSFDNNKNTLIADAIQTAQLQRNEFGKSFF